MQRAGAQHLQQGAITMAARVGIPWRLIRLDLHESRTRDARARRPYRCAACRGGKARRVARDAGWPCRTYRRADRCGRRAVAAVADGRSAIASCRRCRSQRGAARFPAARSGDRQAWTCIRRRRAAGLHLSGSERLRSPSCRARTIALRESYGRGYPATAAGLASNGGDGRADRAANRRARQAINDADPRGRAIRAGQGVRPAFVSPQGAATIARGYASRSGARVRRGADAA